MASDICVRRGGIGNPGGGERRENSLPRESSRGSPFFEARVKFVRITAGQYMNCNEKQVAGKDRSE